LEPNLSKDRLRTTTPFAGEHAGQLPKNCERIIIEGLIRLGKLPESASKARTVLGITPQTPKKRDLLRITLGLPSPPDWWLDPRDANDEPLKWPNCLAQALQYQENHPHGTYSWYVQTMLRAATNEELEAAKNKILTKIKS